MEFTAEEKADLAFAAKIGTALGHIKGAWVAGRLQAGISMLMVVGTVVLADTPDRLSGLWSLIDVALVVILVFGVYRKSRICSILLLSYVLLVIVGSLMTRPSLGGVVLPLVFVYFYVQGVRGTFAYHFWTSGRASAAQEATA